MVIDTVEVRFVDTGDFVVIHDEECTVIAVYDNGDYFTVEFTDSFGDKETENFDPYDELQIWGN